MNANETENHLEVYGDSDWKDGWPETIVVFNTKTRADEVYVRYRQTAAADLPRCHVKDTESLIEGIRANIDAIKHITRREILSVSFETLERIETIGSDLYIEVGRLKKLRGIELEKLFVAGKINK